MKRFMFTPPVGRLKVEYARLVPHTKAAGKGSRPEQSRSINSSVRTIRNRDLLTLRSRVAPGITHPVSYPKGGVMSEQSEKSGLIPHLVVKGAAEAIEFYKAGLGATEIARMPGPDGRLMH